MLEYKSHLVPSRSQLSKGDLGLLQGVDPLSNWVNCSLGKIIEKYMIQQKGLKTLLIPEELAVQGSQEPPHEVWCCPIPVQVKQL